MNTLKMMKLKMLKMNIKKKKKNRVKIILKKIIQIVL